MNPFRLAVTPAIVREIASNPDDFVWPTSWQSYEFISNELLLALAEAARLFGNGDTESYSESKRAALPWIVIADIYGDLAKAATIAVDLRGIRAAGATVAIDTDAYPLHAWLSEGGDGPLNFLNRRFRWTKNPAGRERRLALVKRMVRRTKMMLIPQHRRFDLMGTNGLLQEFVETRKEAVLDLYIRLLGIPKDGKLPTSLAAAACTITDAFMAVMTRHVGDDLKLLSSLRRMATYRVNTHLGRAWAAMGYIETLRFDKRIADILIGGTPKAIGRLLGWYYQRNGKQVYRFAHGGDRAFFIDFSWSLSELPFCDRYYGHGMAEATNLGTRAASGLLAPLPHDAPSFRSLGSQRHRRIFDVSRRLGPTRGRSRKILYVPGLYTSEQLAQTPAFKPPDMLYLEWQIWLLKTLRSAGYEVIIKTHPKGMVDGSEILGDFCDGVVGGYFNALASGYDCLLFDFPGSAWFDALASRDGIVFVNIGRPVDPAAQVDLEQRCALVASHTDNQNRFRVEPADLVHAIERAMEFIGCSPDFADKYFGPTPNN